MGHNGVVFHGGFYCVAECGCLSEQERGLKALARLNSQRSEAKGDRIGIVSDMLRENAFTKNAEIVERFARSGIDITEDTAYRYKVRARRISSKFRMTDYGPDDMSSGFRMTDDP